MKLSEKNLSAASWLLLLFALVILTVASLASCRSAKKSSFDYDAKSVSVDSCVVVGSVSGSERKEEAIASSNLSIDSVKIIAVPVVTDSTLPADRKPAAFRPVLYNLYGLNLNLDSSSSVVANDSISGLSINRHLKSDYDIEAEQDMSRDHNDYAAVIAVAAMAAVIIFIFLSRFINK